MANIRYEVVSTPAFDAAVEAIGDRAIQGDIVKRCESLHYEPEKQGKPLVEELAGHYSIRVARKRYRVVYRINQDSQMVIVELAGIRKEGDKNDVYKLAAKLAAKGEL